MSDDTASTSAHPTPEQVAASPAFANLVPLMTGVAELSARKLSALKRAAADMDGTTDPVARRLMQLGIEEEAGLLAMLGGDPDAVIADHVTAWVVDDTGTGLTYGFRAVPESLTEFNPATGRLEASYSEVAHILGL